METFQGSAETFVNTNREVRSLDGDVPRTGGDVTDNRRVSSEVISDGSGDFTLSKGLIGVLST